MKFKILAGTHRQGGVSYRKGAVIDSVSDLAKTFGRNKFQRVDESTPLSEGAPKKAPAKSIVQEEEVEDEAAGSEASEPTNTERAASASPKKWDDEDEDAPAEASGEEKPAKAKRTRRH